MNNQDLVNEIRQKIDIVDLISEYIPLVQKGKNYFGVCPFHNDTNPSMSVSREKQIYNCFSCGASGNAFNFIMEYDHIDFKEAIKVFTQSDKDYIDLVNDAEIWGVLPGLPVGDQVLNRTQITFTLTPFVSTLCQAASGMTVSFTLIATDNDDEEILIEGDTPVVTLIVP